MTPITRNVCVATAFIALIAIPARILGQEARTRAQAIDAAVEYLKSHQASDGTWSRKVHPGITAIALTGLLRTGKITAQDAAAQKALKFIESQVDPKEGDIALPVDGKQVQKNYTTVVNLEALTATGERKKYGSIINNAVAYLKKLPGDEETGKKPADPWYGGVGYGPGTRPDLSNTHYFLDGLHAAGVKDDPLLKKVVIFVGRCQNLKSEYNDQPWAGAINDGSFIYVLGNPKSKESKPDSPRPGYGGMTFAGLKSLADCGVTKEDPRYKKAWEWVTKNYTVEANPGLPTASASKGYYYYLVTMARCLESLGIDQVVDSSGAKHDWRAEMTAALLKRQKSDGSWVNESPTWLESNVDLCTGFALIALDLAKPKTP